MKIYFQASEPTGGGNVRSFWPAGALRDRGWAVDAGVEAPPLRTYDVVVIHRPLGRDTLDNLRRLRRTGTRVLVDEDDDLTAVADTKNTIAKMILAAPGAMDRHDQSIREADGLIVTTPALREVYGPLSRRTFVCPNYLPADLRTWAGWRSRDGRVRVGWAGITKTHAHDLDWLRPVAREALDGAILNTVGDQRTFRLLGLDASTGIPLEFTAFRREPADLYRAMARCDVGIVPLSPIPFNRAKSWLKALEYASLGKPVVASDLPEQRRLIRHGKTGFLAKTPAEFAGYVQRLVHDEDLRERMGAAALQRARSLAIHRKVGCWEGVLRDAATWTETEAAGAEGDRGQPWPASDPRGAAGAASRAG